LAALRIALLGGSDSLRASKRSVIEADSKMHVVFDSDGFGVLPQDFLNVNFDVAIIEQRLGAQSAFDFIKFVHSLAKVNQETVGRILVGSQFNETELRLLAIESGAVDCVFVSDGISSLIEKISLCSEPNPDYAIRELVPQLANLNISQEGFQNAAVALDTLDSKETQVLKAFCELKSVADIAKQTQISKVKVEAALAKIQTLLMLDTRSQLVLRMYRLGALAL
jgi:DNA-binding NarL/FixJ family response regulator